jgi:hypothetical protein
MVSTAGGIVIAIVVLLIAGAIGWVVFTQMRARRLGVCLPSLMLSKQTTDRLLPQLPPPSIKSYIPFAGSGGGGGIKGWIQSLRNPRSSSGGAYEQPLQGGAAGRRGFGPLDPDEAWDSRVGHEADTYGPYGAYEEQGFAGAGSSYTGASGVRGGGADTYDMNVATGPDDTRGRRPGGRNPFDDDAEPSNIAMRGISPRPLETNAPVSKQQQGGSPTERRSMFRENV